MKKEKWKTFVTDRWKVAAPGLLAAFAVCFIFFIYAPLELYVTNQTELHYAENNAYCSKNDGIRY